MANKLVFSKSPRHSLNPDNSLIAKTKQLKFKGMFENYQLDMLGFETVTERNIAIKSIYSNGKHDSYYAVQVLKEVLGDESVKEFRDAMKTINTVLGQAKRNLNTKRATVGVCLQCKESIMSKPNRAKPSKHLMHPKQCPICTNSIIKVYNIPKTYFHPKDKNASTITKRFNSQSSRTTKSTGLFQDL